MIEDQMLYAEFPRRVAQRMAQMEADKAFELEQSNIASADQSVKHLSCVALSSAPKQLANLIEITDATDSRLNDYLRLREATLRKQLENAAGIFIAEGEKVIARALAAGFKPKSFMLAPKWLPGLAAEIPEQTPVYLVSEALAEKVTGFHVHRGALAAFYREERYQLADFRDFRRVMLLEDIVDHANVGAILRNAAGLGWDGVILSPRSADPCYRRAIKVAMGTVFSLPWVRAADWKTLIPTLQSWGFTVAALALSQDAVDIANFQPPDKLAIVLGTEGHGISNLWRSQADLELVIPMRAGVDSLNVAATSALAGYLLQN